MKALLSKVVLPLMVILTDPRTLAEKVNTATYTVGFQLTGPIALIIIYSLIYAGSFLGSYALAIILITVLIRLLLLNLTVSQIRMMKLNQYMAPLAKRLQEKYKHDKTLMNQKLMLLYQQFRFNPLSGCIAMFLQIIILFGVYRALYDPVFLGQSFWGIQLLFPMNLYYAARFAKGFDLSSAIFNYVAEHNISWQVLQWSYASGGKIYKWAIYWPALALVVLYVITSLIMQRVMRKVSAPDPAVKNLFDDGKKVKRDKSKDFADIMQRQMGIFNIMLVLIAFILSAGALLYFIVQNLLMMIEYTLIPKVQKLSYTSPELMLIMDRVEKGVATSKQTVSSSSKTGAIDLNESAPDKEEEEEQEIVRLRQPFKKKR